MTESGEGDPVFEQAEQQALGTSTYAKAEVVHRYADAHPWIHPIILLGAVAALACVGMVLFRGRVKYADVKNSPPDE